MTATFFTQQTTGLLQPLFKCFGRVLLQYLFIDLPKIFQAILAEFYDSTCSSVWKNPPRQNSQWYNYWCKAINCTPITSQQVSSKCATQWHSELIWKHWDTQPIFWLFSFTLFSHLSFFFFFLSCLLHTSKTPRQNRVSTIFKDLWKFWGNVCEKWTAQLRSLKVCEKWIVQLRPMKVCEKWIVQPRPLKGCKRGLE